MSRFEIKEVHISDIVLDKESYAPKRKLNIQVELNFEAQPNIKHNNFPTPEQLAKEIGDEVTKALSNTTCYTSVMTDVQKNEIIIRPIENGFGWCELNTFNQKIEE